MLVSRFRETIGFRGDPVGGRVVVRGGDDFGPASMTSVICSFCTASAYGPSGRLVVLAL